MWSYRYWTGMYGGMSGPFPDLSKVPNLTILYGAISLVGARFRPLSNDQRLLTSHLGTANIVGGIPTTFNGTTNPHLTEFSLVDVNVDGTLPSTLGTLDSLEILCEPSQLFRYFYSLWVLIDILGN